MKPTFDKRAIKFISSLSILLTLINNISTCDSSSAKGRNPDYVYSGEDISGRHHLRHCQQHDMPVAFCFRMENLSWPKNTDHAITGEFVFSVVNQNVCYSGYAYFFKQKVDGKMELVAEHEINFIRNKRKFVGKSIPAKNCDSLTGYDTGEIYYELLLSENELSMSGACWTDDGVEHGVVAVIKI